MSFFKPKSKTSNIPTSSGDDLRDELHERDKIKNVFPLWVFNEKVHPYIDALSKNYDIPRAFIGLAMLSAYSTVIGTSYVFSSNGEDKNYLPIWGCLNGMTSSGKSLVISKVFAPINKIQTEMDQKWEEDHCQSKPEDMAAGDLQQIIFRDVHISTLTRYVMPGNPKGLIKVTDELMEWINGMDAMSRKEGTDVQFWLSSWNSLPYSVIRSGKQKTSLPRPFLNVLGGIQPGITWKLFSKDRDTTGFIYRVLFATQEFKKIAEPEWDYTMDSATAELHNHLIARLQKELPVYSQHDKPKKVIMTQAAIEYMRDWEKEKIKFINSLKDDMEKEVHASVFGKIKEYAKRFIGILTIVDKAYSHDIGNSFAHFSDELPADSSIAKRAVELADYFYASAYEIYEDVKTRVTAPPDVLLAANLFRAGKSYERIAEVLYGDAKAKSKAHRNVKKWILEYPKIYGAVAK